MLVLFTSSMETFSFCILMVLLLFSLMNRVHSLWYDWLLPKLGKSSMPMREETSVSPGQWSLCRENHGPCPGKTLRSARKSGAGRGVIGLPLRYWSHLSHPSAEHSVWAVKYLESLQEDINYNLGAESEDFRASRSLERLSVWDPHCWVGTEAPGDEAPGPYAAQSSVAWAEAGSADVGLWKISSVFLGGLLEGWVSADWFLSSLLTY